MAYYEEYYYPPEEEKIETPQKIKIVCIMFFLSPLTTLFLGMFSFFTFIVNSNMGDFAITALGLISIVGIIIGYRLWKMEEWAYKYSFYLTLGCLALSALSFINTTYTWIVSVILISYYSIIFVLLYTSRGIFGYA